MSLPAAKVAPVATTASYLGPAHHYQSLSTWQQVENAARDQLLDENQWVELKKDIPEGKGDTRETAKDLASLGVYGGTLIVGVAEVKDGRGKTAGEVVGAPTATLADRVSSIAATLVKPALMVITHVIAHPEDPDLGLLVTTVPASADGPHMVDGSYWGRSAVGKRKLEDVEVRRLIAERSAATAGFEERLRAVATLDAPEMSHHPRLYLLIEPTVPARRPITELLEGSSAARVARESLTFAPPWEPSLASLSHEVPHARGLAACSQSEQNRTPRYYLITLIDQGGAVRVCGSAAHRPEPDPDSDQDVSAWVWVAHVMETIHSALQLAAHLAERYTGHQGTWQVGVVATNMAGAKISLAANQRVMRRTPYQESGYERVVSATTQQLGYETGQVVDKLVRDMLRGLGVDRLYLPYLETEALWRIEDSRSS